MAHPSIHKDQQSPQAPIRPQNEEAPKHQTGHQMSDRKSGRESEQSTKRQKDQSAGTGQEGSMGKFSDSEKQSPQGSKKKQ